MSNFSDLFGEISKDLNKGFETLNKSVNELFNTATGADGEPQEGATTNEKGFTVPLINIVETPESFRVEVAAPGYEKKNFKLQIENDALIIKGKKSEVQANKGETSLMQEHNYDEFKRSFSLNEKIGIKSFLDVLYGKFRFIESRLNTRNHIEKKSPHLLTKEMQVLSLHSDHDAILNTYRKDRRKDLGKKIMIKSIEQIKEDKNEKKIELSAQKYLLKFYLELGFKKTGKEYLEDGIPHVKMILKI